MIFSCSSIIIISIPIQVFILGKYGRHKGTAGWYFHLCYFSWWLGCRKRGIITTDPPPSHFLALLLKILFYSPCLCISFFPGSFLFCHKITDQLTLFQGCVANAQRSTLTFVTSIVQCGTHRLIFLLICSSGKYGKTREEEKIESRILFNQHYRPLINWSLPRTEVYLSIILRLSKRIIFCFCSFLLFYFRLVSLYSQRFSAVG